MAADTPTKTTNATVAPKTNHPCRSRLLIASQALGLFPSSSRAPFTYPPLASRARSSSPRAAFINLFITRSSAKPTLATVTTPKTCTPTLFTRSRCRADSVKSQSPRQRTKSLHRKKVGRSVPQAAMYLTALASFNPFGCLPCQDGGVRKHPNSRSVLNPIFRPSDPRLT
jgi:hypothetical protein